MTNLPLVRANVLLPIMKLLSEHSISTEEFLRQTKFPENIFYQPETLISLYQVFNTVELFAHRQGVELLGVLASQKLQIEDIGLFGKVINQSLTGYDLLQTIVALLTKTYSSGVKVWLTQDQDKVWFNHKYVNFDHWANYQCQYYACLVHLKVMWLIMGSGWYPTDLHFQGQKLQGLSEIDRLSQSRIRFNQPHNAIGIAKNLLYLPIKKHSQHNVSNEQNLYEELYLSAPSRDFIDSLRQFIQYQLPSGNIKIQETAESAGISVRSLQRRLAERGLSYSHLLDQVRFQLAVDWLKDSTIPIGNIALELHYSELSNFTRAFQRWAGVTPSEYRCLSRST